METKRIFLGAQVRGSQFEKDQREFDFVITTDKRDTYGTIFTADGWDFNRYTENPVVFYQHRSSGDDPDNLIGVTVKGPWKETLADGSRAWVARVRIEDEEVNAKAEKIRKKIIAGTIRMASIGADVHEYRWGDKDKGEDAETVYFTRQELFEWSVVNVGSNPSAHVRNNEVLTEIRTALTPAEESDKDTTEKEQRTTTEQKEKTGLRNEVARLQLEKYKSKVK